MASVWRSERMSYFLVYGGLALSCLGVVVLILLILVVLGRV